MTYGTSQNGQDTPPSQEFATAISATGQMEQIRLNSTMTSGADLWPDPQPLENREAPEAYPVEALPEAIRKAVIEAKAFYQAPVPLIAASALGTLSLATQGHIDVARSGKLTGPTSLYSLVIARSGERKTSCDRHFMKAIHDHVQELEKQTEPELVKWSADYRAWQAEIKGLEARITALSKDTKGKPDELDKAKNDLRVLEASEPAKPLEPRMIYTDFTPEVLGFNLATGYPTAGVISSEGGTVLGSHGMGKDSIMRNLALINQLWDGAAVRVDRRTSDSFTIREARLTVSLQVQQEALREFYAKNGELARGSGFMARFLISAPQSTQGTRLFKDEPDTWPALEKFNDRLKAILSDELPMTDKCRLEPYIMTFPPEVKTIWVSQYNAIEKALGNGGKLEDINDMASKAADNIARLAALFHYFEHGKTPICEDCLNRAAMIVLWHLNEAKRFFNDIATPPEQIRLQKLDKWIIREAKTKQTYGMRQNHILQYGPIRKSEQLNEALETLQELDRIRIDRSGNAKLVIINPKLTMF